jgi:hypothetical protein
MRKTLHAGLLVAGMAILASASYAKPEYAKKEMKDCGYCHVKPEGGGTRNDRGVYYAAHNHTFAGLPPMFKSLWKLEAPAGARRVAVGNVAGEKEVRLLLLGEGDKLTVHKVTDGEAPVEDTIALGKGADKLVVGTFAKGKPAVIVVPGAVYYRNEGKYVKKEAPDLSTVTGTMFFKNGTQNFFVYEGGAPDTFSVDLAADKPLVAGESFVPPDQGGTVYSSLTARAPAEMLAGLGVPEEGQKAGTVGLFDPRGEGKMYGWIPWADKDGSNTLRVVDGAGIGPGVGGDIKVLWTSPKLAGKILDVAVAADPKGSKNTGLVILMATGADGKGRTVEFFALD